MCLFSIIIPVYNRSSLIIETLESIRDSEFQDCEIIVVDDGSTDDTYAVLQDYNAKSIRLFTKENAGPGAARNLGAKEAKGEYLLFLDSDDFFFPWTLDVYRKVISETQASFIAGSPKEFSDMNELSGLVEENLSYELFKDYLASSDKWRWWGASSFVIKTSAFKAVGGFEDKWMNGEDADLTLSLACADKFVDIKQPHTFAYRQHEVSEMKNYQRTIDGAMYMLERELSDDYPGSKERAKERRIIISRHLRPVILHCLHNQQRALAKNMFMKTFKWHLQQWRLKFLGYFIFKWIFK